MSSDPGILCVQHGHTQKQVLIDPEYSDVLALVPWRVIGGRVMSLNQNRLIDLLSLLGQPHGLPYLHNDQLSFQRQDIQVPSVTFDTDGRIIQRSSSAQEHRSSQQSGVTISPISDSNNTVKIPGTDFLFSPMTLNGQQPNIAQVKTRIESFLIQVNNAWEGHNRHILSCLYSFQNKNRHQYLWSS